MPEHPSTYFVDDRSSADDLTRLQIQDQMVTQAMGGVLPEQANPTRFQRVLDVGCGTGGWLLEAARTYPSMPMLVGIDISSRMVAFARQQAVAHHLGDRVTFQVMDALRMLEFPDRFFDLVNQRAGVSYLRTWEWPKVLQEYHRVTRPGGIVRISEGEWAPESNSPALSALFELLLHAFFQAGHSFTLARDGVTSHLVPLLQQHDFHHVRSRLVPQEYRIISSISGYKPSPSVQYGSAKAAEIFLSSALALELGSLQIRINTVCPGSTLFPGGGWERYQQRHPEQFAQFQREEFPLGRLATPEEIARVVTFVASPAASWINGAMIPVDGGQQHPAAFQRGPIWK